MSSSNEESTDLDFTERKESAALWALIALLFFLYGLGMYTDLRKSPKTLLFAEVLRVPSLVIAFQDIRTEYPIVAALEDESSQRAASALMVLTTVLCARVFAVAWKSRRREARRPPSLSYCKAMAASPKTRFPRMGLAPWPRKFSSTQGRVNVKKTKFRPRGLKRIFILFAEWPCKTIFALTDSLLLGCISQHVPSLRTPMLTTCVVGT